MSKIFIIAEAACTWLFGKSSEVHEHTDTSCKWGMEGGPLENAYRSIRAAKECGADAWKTQWTSDPLAMGKRRGVDGEKYRRLPWDPSWLPLLKAECDKVGIEFMCTVFLPKDVEIISPYVKRFKIAATEAREIPSEDSLFNAVSDEINNSYNTSGIRPTIISAPEGMDVCWKGSEELDIYTLHVVTDYPTRLEDLHLTRLSQTMNAASNSESPYKVYQRFDGLSDHTTSVLTGAVAVGAGARIIEKHVRLSDTPSSDPDYGHSLVLDCYCGTHIDDCEFHHDCFRAYVDNIREAERML